MRTFTFIFLLFIILFSGLSIYSCDNERYWSNPHDPNTDLLPEDWRPKNLIFLKNSSYELFVHWEYERDNIGGFKLENKNNNGDWAEYALLERELRELIIQYNETPVDSLDIDFRMLAHAGPNQSAYDTTIISEDAVKIITVDYDIELMHISWDKCQRNDFDFYQILYSENMEGIKTVLDTIFQIDSTSFSLNEFSPFKANWFWSRIVTKTGRGFLGEGRTNDIETAPNPLDIVSVEYDLSKMTISWEEFQNGSGKIMERFPSSNRNNSISDFESYDLFHSLSETGGRNLVAVIEDELQTSYQVLDFDPTHENWYWLRVNDYWGLSSTGNGMTHEIDEPPTAIDITSIEYDILPLHMTISWEPSQDWDFTSYRLQYSDTESGEKTNIVTISDINTISFEIPGFDSTWISNDLQPFERWYWLETTDHWGQSTDSDGYMVYDEPPSQGMLYPIIYEDDSFFISWKQNQDDDFALYRLFEAGVHNYNIPDEIYFTVNRGDTTFSVSGINTDDDNYRYYQIVYEDIWGSQTLTNVEDGISYPRFFKTFGGENNDIGYSVTQTPDNDYIAAGYTNSFGSGSYDVLLLKIDADGNEIWMKTFGEGYDDRGYSMQQTQDGGFIIAGYSYSFDSDSYDMLLLKTDAYGNEVWKEVYGGTETEGGYSVQQTNDGGFIIVGYTNSFGNGGFDIFLLKTGFDGNQEWNKTFGSNETDKGYSVKQTDDLGFIISGITSADYGFDVRVVKTDADGNEEWNKVYGSTLNDFGFNIIQTDDGGFIVVGYTEIFGSGDEDVLLLKIDINGNQEWAKTFGGNGIDRGHSVIQTPPDGFLITGITESFGDNNKDVWLIKTDSNGDSLWTQTIGTDKIDHGYSVSQTMDGGFIITGYTESENNNDDIILIKTDPLGNTQFDY